ncbi:MAG: hypothetical protein WD208_11790 [Dehalococcoidia bacterium]
MDTLSADETAVTLVNLNPVKERTLVVQGGAYGEHQVVSVTAEGREIEVDHPHFTVHLAPGSGERLLIRMNLYVNQSTFAFPWTV